MKFASNTFGDGGVIPGRCGFAIKAPRGRITLGRNRNPELHWSQLPAGTRSLVLTAVDGDAPSPKPANVNTEGAVLAPGLPRGEFTHWLMVDIAPDVSSLAEGFCSDGVVAGGKRHPRGPAGSRHGVNDYTAWFGDDRDMGGLYFGYDGPCPPWNDSVPHHYRFELHATDWERCPVDGPFRLAELRKALDGHVLAAATLTGRYTLSPSLRIR
jgi:Raf kinase inhibitor-like YbhB/YbcL family protein